MSMLRILLIIIFLIAALAVTIIVLLQEGKSAGLGSMTGATGGDSYWEKNKKHSLEGKFEKWTKITAVVFVLSAFLIMLIPNNNTTPATTPDTESSNVTLSGVETEEQAADETATDAETTDGAATDEAATDATSTDEAATETDSAAASN